MKNTLISAIFFFILSMFGCTKNTTIFPTDPTADIVDKWWCDTNKKTASQYFKTDGSWEQGSKGGRFNDTGKWTLSADKKKIIIGNILDSNKKPKTNWEYELSSASTTKLLMNFSALNLVMDMAVCP